MAFGFSDCEYWEIASKLPLFQSSSFIIHRSENVFIYLFIYLLTVYLTVISLTQLIYCGMIVLDMEHWIIKDTEGSELALVEILPWHLPEETKLKPRNAWVMTASLRREVSTTESRLQSRCANQQILRLSTDFTWLTGKCSYTSSLLSSPWSFARNI
jgi:hypothetical protein